VEEHVLKQGEWGEMPSARAFVQGLNTEASGYLVPPHAIEHGIDYQAIEFFELDGSILFRVG
jgi:hypothetical protein